jgi:hypothetical protein
MARDQEFLRPPNHLNPILTDVAKIVHFGNANIGEDLDWTIRMAKTGFLTHEYKSDDTRIHYIYNMGPRHVDVRALEFQKQTNYQTMLSVLWGSNGAIMPQTPQSTSSQTLRLTPRGFVSK